MAAYRDKDGRWRYRAKIKLPMGRRVRISGSTPKLINTKEAAQQAERDHIFRMQNPQVDESQRKEVPTVDTFQKEFMKTYVAANNKPSERIAKVYMFKYHLVPEFGTLRLDQITAQHIEKFKAKKLEKHPVTGKQLAPKTVNNFLVCLGKLLRYAEECELIDKVPRIKLIRLHRPRFDFLDFDECERLVKAASGEAEVLAMVLLAVDAGLRIGEMRALEWGDLDLVAGVVTVQRTNYRGYVGSPKGGRLRTIPLTKRLLGVLKEVRHLRGQLVFCTMDGKSWTPDGEVKSSLRRTRTKAGLRHLGWHTLRHTFCSHLAMRGAPVRTIQELAGHTSLTTTQRYMHLTPLAARSAIELLESKACQTGAKTEGGQPNP